MSLAARCGSAHRALQTHGHDLGYEIARGSTTRCRPPAVELAREHDDVPVLIEQVRLATPALTQAAAAAFPRRAREDGLVRWRVSDVKPYGA